MDDDYRYSMLYGSFVTLTNLTEETGSGSRSSGSARCTFRCMRPIPTCASRSSAIPRARASWTISPACERAGIDFHAQLVLCPGVNDGAEIDRSLRDLGRPSTTACVRSRPFRSDLTRHGLERQSKQVRLSRTCMRLLPGKQIAVRRYEPEEATGGHRARQSRGSAIPGASAARRSSIWATSST